MPKTPLLFLCCKQIFTCEPVAPFKALNPWPWAEASVKNIRETANATMSALPMKEN